MSLHNPCKNPEVREKISSTLKGKKLSAEHRKKISDGLYKAMTPEVRAKISAGNKGKKLSAKTKIKLKESKLGKKNPSYHKHWFNDGQHNVFCRKRPKGFVRGRIISKRTT